jgi:BirA family biotin operon repressor/biotin-[acetyl-CoA-carboxylase] ligase
MVIFIKTQKQDHSFLLMWEKDRMRVIQIFLLVIYILYFIIISVNIATRIKIKMKVNDTMKKNDLERVKNNLHQQNFIIGREIHYYESVPSTMIIAKELALEGAQDGTVVLADIQNVGRGRLGRSWSSPKGGIWMSIILRPSVSSEETPLITLAAGVAVCQTIKKLYLINSGLKWPNDVIINRKKVCGILTEGCIDSGTIKFAILGIGVNLNFSSNLLPKDLSQYASTLLSESGKHINSIDFFHQLLKELDAVYRYLGNNNLNIIKSWRDFSVTIGKEVVAAGNDNVIVGIAKDITSDGSLVIETKNGELIEVRSGEVSLRAKGSYA